MVRRGVAFAPDPVDGGCPDRQRRGSGLRRHDQQRASEDNFGYISTLGFTDLAGNPLALSYVTQTGFTYPMASAPAVVPEPSTLALILLSAWGLAMSRRRGVKAGDRRFATW